MRQSAEIYISDPETKKEKWHQILPDGFKEKKYGGKGLMATEFSDE